MLNTRWFCVFAEHQVFCVLSSTYSCICLKANRKKRHVIMFQDELKENMSLPFFFENTLSRCCDGRLVSAIVAM